MKILSTNNLLFGTSNNTPKVSNTKEKKKDITGPLALGLVIASTAAMFIRTDPSRISKLATRSSTNKKRYLRSGALEIEVKNFKDDKNVKSLDELSGLEKIKEFFDEYLIITQHPDVKKEHNIQDYSSLLFWGSSRYW